jgi:hypothetical protein
VDTPPTHAAAGRLPMHDRVPVEGGRCLSAGTPHVRLDASQVALGLPYAPLGEAVSGVRAASNKCG